MMARQRPGHDRRVVIDSVWLLVPFIIASICGVICVEQTVSDAQPGQVAVIPLTGDLWKPFTSTGKYCDFAVMIQCSVSISSL